jgi:hypothetical protein
MFQVANPTVQSPTLWIALAQQSLANILNRGCYNTTYNMFYNNMTVAPAAAVDIVQDPACKGTTCAQACEGLLQMYGLTGNANYLQQAQIALSAYYALLWDTNLGGMFYNITMTTGVIRKDYKETRSTSDFLKTFHLANLYAPMFKSQELACLSTVLNSLFRPMGQVLLPGFWYRQNPDFTVFVDNFHTVWTGQLSAIATAGATTIQVTTLTGALPGSGNIVLVMEGIDNVHGAANDEEIVVNLPIVGGTLTINSNYNGTGQLIRTHANGTSVTTIIPKSLESQITSEACGIVSTSIAFSQLSNLI